MEPNKVQSEGGLNVTLTIRLLMHGKVKEQHAPNLKFRYIKNLLLHDVNTSSSDKEQILDTVCFVRGRKGLKKIDLTKI